MSLFSFPAPRHRPFPRFLLGSPLVPASLAVLVSSAVPASLAVLVSVAVLAAPPAAAQTSVVDATAEVTFSRDIAPILQRSCQNCHRPNSVAPMSLLSYEEVRPWTPMIEERTAIRDRMGAMPPWFIEKDVGIQAYKNDISLSDEEIKTIAAWVDAGAPEGDPADLPPPLDFAGEDEWAIGEPDLVIDLPPYTMAANAPDWWGRMAPVPTGLTEDRHVSAMEVKEISDVEGGVGGQFIYHHAIFGTVGGGAGGGMWPVHEVGRNAQFFDSRASPRLSAGSQFMIAGVHMNSNAVETTAHLRVGFTFHPVGYEPEHRPNLLLTFGTGEIDLKPRTAEQAIDFYATLDQNMRVTTFEPHMHASGVRMCLEAIWGGRSETLTCTGYDHNWVRVYDYEEHAQPLLPRGTIIHVTGYFDTTAQNPNVVDPRNWQGLGHRSIDNMAITFLPGVPLSDEDFAAAVRERREHLGLGAGEGTLGCPLCAFEELPSGWAGGQ